MPGTEEKRPTSIAEMLHWIADYLDLADKAVNQLAEFLSKSERLTGTEMQDDLHKLACWFEEHRGLDEAIHTRLYPLDDAL